MGFTKKNVDIETLFNAIDTRFAGGERDLIHKAYTVAEEAHRPQKRRSGEPYIIHPINVAYILFELNADQQAICAGLLHDVVEDTPYKEDSVTRDFGPEICNLVTGVTKFSEIKKESQLKSGLISKERSKQKELAINVSKILEASQRDMRVLIIKLADKTHNMRTITFQPPEKQAIIAREVLDVYSPIAGRLGVYTIKSELEDLAFQVLEPVMYQQMKEKIKLKKSEREQDIEKIKHILRTRFEEYNLQADMEGRAKHFYSIYTKMTQKNKTFDQIYDLRALRIITNEIRDCYGALGFIHSMWKPIEGRFKDYIGCPKSNLYQSLHTTVMGPDGHPVEFQIRTREMHETAEKGLAAHWIYKANINEPIQKMWSDRINFFRDAVTEPDEFLKEFSIELKEREIFAFTPTGETINLPKGSTALDFAFHIHTDVGIHAKMAKVDGRLVTLRTELRSGNQVEIITDNKSFPSPIWLRFVKSAISKQKLKQYFKGIQNVPTNNVTSLQVVKPTPLTEKEKQELVKQNSANKKKVKKDKYKSTSVEVEGIRDTIVKLSPCCSPLPGDPIIGFITKGRGVSVHKLHCDEVIENTDKKRMVSVSWINSDPIPVWIEVRADDKMGIYSRIVTIITTTKTNMVEASATTKAHILHARFTIEIDHLDQLQEILTDLRSIDGVLSAERVRPI
jgi:GTP diphosphokinase / guanosine-3',5'-bis(diphosphate) 3'-diphosphatase